MDQSTFQRYRSLIYEKSGITLGPQKVALVSARVGKRLRTLGIEYHETYLDYIRKDSTGAELVHLLDAISTNVTSFYREASHYDILADHLQQWMQAGQTRYRLWCAASSTGEEPYCLAMTCLEALQGCRGLDLKILATDISTRVLEKARRGEYPEEKVQAVPPVLRKRYFNAFRADGEAMVRANDSLRRVLSFNRLNLVEVPYPMKGPFDAVFCRNVMIYFDTAVRTNLVREAHRLLRPSGCLMVGHSESLTGLSLPFKPAQPAVYIRL